MPRIPWLRIPRPLITCASLISPTCASLFSLTRPQGSSDAKTKSMKDLGTAATIVASMKVGSSDRSRGSPDRGSNRKTGGSGGGSADARLQRAATLLMLVHQRDASMLPLTIPGISPEVRGGTVISSHQQSSAVFSSHQKSSAVISSHQQSSTAINSHQQSSAVINRHQQSSVIRRHQQAAAGIRGVGKEVKRGRCGEGGGVEGGRVCYGGPRS